MNLHITFWQAFIGFQVVSAFSMVSPIGDAVSPFFRQCRRKALHWIPEDKFHLSGTKGGFCGNLLIFLFHLKDPKDGCLGS